MNRRRSTYQRPTPAWAPIPRWVMLAILAEAAIAIALMFWQILRSVWPTL